MQRVTERIYGGTPTGRIVLRESVHDTPSEPTSGSPVVWILGGLLIAGIAGAALAYLATRPPE